jgi:hypothetical protein
MKHLSVISYSKQKTHHGSMAVQVQSMTERAERENQWLTTYGWQAEQPYAGCCSRRRYWGQTR